MGLLRGLARTAAVAGTATVVAKGVSRRQDNRAAKKDAEAAQAEDVATPPAEPATDPQVAQLQQMADLHNQGILTDEEFAAKKQQILGL